MGLAREEKRGEEDLPVKTAMKSNATEGFWEWV